MLTQSEADDLLAMEKKFEEQTTVSLNHGVDDVRRLVAEKSDERFLLDVWRNSLRLSKLKYQHRARKTIILARLDVDGSPHQNPDGEIVAGSHLHVYREGYDAKWAVPLDRNQFANPADVVATFRSFCDFCNILELPMIQSGL